VKDLTTEKAEVLFHAGCRYAFDESLRQTVRDGLSLLAAAGVDVGIMAAEENCCGGRSHEMGYIGEFAKYAQHNVDTWKTAGVKCVVTPCADCYQAFSVLYDKSGNQHPVEILHLTEYLARLVKEGTIRMSKEVPLTATYHDPCHLDAWRTLGSTGKGRRKCGQLLIHDPQSGSAAGQGCTSAERLLRAIPISPRRDAPHQSTAGAAAPEAGAQCLPDFMAGRPGAARRGAVGWRGGDRHRLRLVQAHACRRG
jgi:hypothetical protein